jgi:hypothetical protein
MIQTNLVVFMMFYSLQHFPFEFGLSFHHHVGQHVGNERLARFLAAAPLFSSY